MLCSPTPQSKRVKLGSFMSQGCNDGKEMYKIVWCTCKFVVLSIKTFYFFCRSPSVLSPSSLVLLSSTNSSTMVTWRHTSPLYNTSFKTQPWVHKTFSCDVFSFFYPINNSGKNACLCKQFKERWKLMDVHYWSEKFSFFFSGLNEA